VSVKVPLSDVKRIVIYVVHKPLRIYQGGLATEDTASKIQTIVNQGTPQNTKKAYQSDIHYFMAWARVATGYDQGFPVPTGLVLRFITDHLMGLDEGTDESLVRMGIKAQTGTHSINTVCRRIASLSAAHEAQSLKNPCRSKEVTTLLSKARKAMIRQGIEVIKKNALTKDLLLALISSCSDSLNDIRDKALLLFAFASGGRRRSEIANATIEHLRPVEIGYVYHMPYSKTDQEGEGKEVPVLGQAALALNAWLKASGITEGPLFRSITKGGVLGEGITDKTVARIVKKRARMAGLDPTLFSAHSLRSGFITEAGRQGKALADAMALSGHRSLKVALGYHQAGSAELLMTEPA